LTTLDQAISTYQDALNNLPQHGDDNASSRIMDLFIARDAVAAALEDGQPLSASAVTRITSLDEKLKDAAAKIDAVAGRKTLANWRQSVHPLKSPWWWSLDELAAASEPQSNPLWTIPAALFFTLSLSVIAETLNTLRSGGINGLTVFGTLLQTLLALLAGSAFLSGGREWLGNLFSNLGINRKFKGASRVWLALGVLLLTLLIRTMLPDAVARYRNYKGDEDFNNKQFASAVQNYQQAVALKPNYFKALFNLALAHDKTRDYSKAIDEYERSIAADEENYTAYNNLARLYILQKKDYNGALGRLNYLRTNLPKLPPGIAYFLFKNRGWANLELGHYRQAAEDLEWALTKQNGAAAHYLLGRVYAQQNRKEEAKQQWDNFMKAVQHGLGANEEVEPDWIAQAQEQLTKGDEK
jgi:tetratricopeptide (TPR) repeat protein